MIEVRIRRESEGTAKHLCQWPATELDTLIPTIEAWGVQDMNTDAFGEFVIDDTGAYFEVVIAETEDGAA